MLIDLKRMMFVVAVTVAASFVIGSVSAAEDDGKKPADVVQPDNTKTNERDRNRDEVTADNQKQSKSDVEMTSKIRQAVVKDDSLSTNAHNIKIITINGVVTLKGPVKTADEKTKIETAAKSVAGDANVKNQIDVTP
jgi:hyperosmotically inducible protein